MKKFFAVALATTMALGSALSVMAEDVDCTGWWTAHSQGYEIDEDGLTLTFHSQTYATATGNWDSPIYVVYQGDEAKVEGSGYTELFVMRSDNYGWSTSDGNTAANMSKLEELGYALESTGVPSDWSTWLADNKEGVDCTIKATKGDGSVIVEFTNDGVTSKMTIPADTSKPVYLSVSGELCTITDLEEVVETESGDDTNVAEPGDDTNVAEPDDDSDVENPSAGTGNPSADTGNPSADTGNPSADTGNPSTDTENPSTDTENSNIDTTKVLYGDVDGDGKVSLTDSALIRRYLANWNVTIDENLADVDGDGKISLTDSALIRRYLANWNVTLGKK